MFSYPFGSSYYPSRRDRYLQALAEQEERQRYEQALRQRQQMLRQRQYEEALRQKEYEEALREREYQEALRQRHLQQALRQREHEEQQRRARRSYGQEELDPFYSMLFGSPTRASRLSRSLSPESQVRQPQPPSNTAATSSRDASPTASPKPSPSPTPAPPAPTIDLDTPASLIQSTWRTHRSLTSISRILSKFDALRASFTFPTTLDFNPDTRALLYTPTNAPLRAHEHALGKILEELDAVESWGVDKVRKERRRVVNIIESELGAMDEKKRELERATFMEKEKVEMAVDEEPTNTMESESESTVVQEPIMVSAVIQEPIVEPESAPMIAQDDLSSTPSIAAFEHPQQDADTTMHAADPETPLPSSTTSPNAANIPLPAPNADEIPLPESDAEDNSTTDDEDDEMLMENFESARSSPEIVHVSLPEPEDPHPIPAPETHFEDKVVERMLDPDQSVDGFEFL